jgi:hypothetical protein
MARHWNGGRGGLITHVWLVSCRAAAGCRKRAHLIAARSATATCAAADLATRHQAAVVTRHQAIGVGLGSRSAAFLLALSS